MQIMKTATLISREFSTSDDHRTEADDFPQLFGITDIILVDDEYYRAEFSYNAPQRMIEWSVQVQQCLDNPPRITKIKTSTLEIDQSILE
jgi:hypothetical protein